MCYTTLIVLASSSPYTMYKGMKKLILQFFQTKNSDTFGNPEKLH